MFKKKLMSLGLKRFRLNSDDRGWLLVSAIVMIIFLTGIGIAISQLVTLQYQNARLEEYTQNAQLTAEAGIEQTVNQLNIDNTFCGFNSSCSGYPAQTFFNNAVQGMGVFTTTISDNTGGSKTIISTGEVYRNATDTTPYVTRAVKVVVVGTKSSGPSVYSGPGGLILGGNANITNSNVYVGGTITMNGNSQIGTYNQPVKVSAANYACPVPADSTYPSMCDSSNYQPIIFNSNNPLIYGTVCANGQTSTGPNNNIQTGNPSLGFQGLNPSSCGLPIAYNSPTSYYNAANRTTQISAVTNTQDGSSACSTPWTANTEFTGDVSLTGHCNITISGPIYITGNLSIGSSVTITVASSVTSIPTVLVDGTINVNGSAQMLANSSGIGIQFITFKSADSCTTATGSSYCQNLTGTDLYNSQTEQNILINGRVNLPGMIFDAYWSEVVLSGSGNLGAALGQTVYLDGNGSVIFGTQLDSGTQTWTITSYEPYYPTH